MLFGVSLHSERNLLHNIIWGPAILLSLIVDFAIDGTVFMLSYYVYLVVARRSIKIQEGNDQIIPERIRKISREQIFGRTLIHVCAGYGADVIGATLSKNLTYPTRWLILAVTLGVIQGLILMITLGERKYRKGFNIWFGIILFSIITNPFTYPALLPITIFEFP